jgi:hypothetical protein
MDTVFIAGSIAISRLHPLVEARIRNAVEKGLHIVVGDADGADASIQASLQSAGATDVTVYCSGDRPRNNLGDWPTHNVYPDAAPGTRAFFTAKDVEMALAAHYGLMVWDAKSTGTLSNVLELLRGGKKSVVFVNKSKEFVSVSDVVGLETLLSHMSDHARGKAEDKIRLKAKISALSNEQFALSI